MLFIIVMCVAEFSNVVYIYLCLVDLGCILDLYVWDGLGYVFYLDVWLFES